jgi:hypothetical protein
VVRSLSVPDRTVAGRFDRRRRKGRIAGLDLLQASDVGTGLVEPLEQPGSRPLTPLTLKLAIFIASERQQRCVKLDTCRARLVRDGRMALNY